MNPIILGLFAKNSWFLDKEMAFLVINFWVTAFPLSLFSQIYAYKLSSKFGYLADFFGWSLATWKVVTNNFSFFFI